MDFCEISEACSQSLSSDDDTLLQDSRPQGFGDFAKKLDPDAVAAVVFTDISRDGMLTGPNTESTAKLAEAIDIPVIASGGVSCIDDIKELLKVEQSGIMGVITGRALYTGDLDLKACIELTKKCM